MTPVSSDREWLRCKLWEEVGFHPPGDEGFYARGLPRYIGKMALVASWRIDRKGRRRKISSEAVAGMNQRGGKRGRKGGGVADYRSLWFGTKRVPP